MKFESTLHLYNGAVIKAHFSAKFDCYISTDYKYIEFNEIDYIE